MLPRSTPTPRSWHAFSQAALGNSNAQRASIAALTLDVIERIAVAGLCIWLIVRLLAAGLSVGHVLLAVSEGLNAFFITIRRPANQVSWRPGEWLLTVGASTTVLLVVPLGGTGSALVPPSFVAPLLLGGVLMQIVAKLTLGRSFGLLPANRGLILRLWGAALACCRPIVV
jgi:hypothetical protein